MNGVPWVRPLLKVLVAVVLVGALLLVPDQVPYYMLLKIMTVLIVAISLLGMNLVTGYLGEITLAHGAFFGLGAYTAAILSQKAAVADVATLPVAALVGLVGGLLVALPSLRVSGLYLTLVTLACGVAFPGLIKATGSLTNGASGMYGLSWIAPTWTGMNRFDGGVRWGYWVILACLAVTLYVVVSLRRSRFGRAWISLRDNPVSAVVMGVDQGRVKLATFGLSGAIAGLAGALYTFTTGIVTPDQFTLLLSINLLIALIIGGSATILGPLIGGVVYVYLPDLTSDIGGGPVAGVLFGGLLIVLIFVMPSGIAGAAARSARRLLRPDGADRRRSAAAPTSRLGSAALAARHPTPSKNGK